MAPSRSSRFTGADTDTSMLDASDPIPQLQVDAMVSRFRVHERDLEQGGSLGSVVFNEVALV